MKIKTFSSALLCMAIAAGVSACGSGTCDNAKCESSGDTDAYQSIMTRTSIRQYTDRAVSPEAVDSLMRAAMAAPTAGNKQPWKFLVINEREILDSLATMAPGWAPVGRAPLAVIVCGDKELGFPDEANDYWIQDCSAATENLLLAAHSMGLGAVWCGAYPVMERVVSLNRYFHFPSTIVPLNVIAIGYPAESPAPKEKFKPENIRYNKW